MTSPTLTEKQKAAQAAFNLDEAMAALPAPGPFGDLPPTLRGQAGIRLRAHLVADISDDLLREFARETLGAKRCSEQYLDALRVVLGNQADAEQYGYTLEMNRRVNFVAPDILRTIQGQMQRNKVSFSQMVVLGKGRSQVVQCFKSEAALEASDCDHLSALARRTEAADDRKKARDVSRGCVPRLADSGPDPVQTILAEEVPY